ncbi:hypothetical protein [Candidatus Poriferisodalis sp.]|uniref:hypothetical protein n=1 Tax=Candidatus Poriferisodalis sp. TaxID=3101277 RepID=UPI003B51615A
MSGQAGGRGARGQFGGRDDSGETLALLILWPAIIMAILVMLVHAFIVSNARAEAETAASEGLRTAWRYTADADFLADSDDPAEPYLGIPTHPEVLEMVEQVKDTVARVAGESDGWRWWRPGVAQVHSDWCYDGPGDAGLQSVGERRPVAGETGWVRVVISGEAFGPMAALWPDRWEPVYAAAQGPAIVVRRGLDGGSSLIPAELPVC